MTGKPKKKEDAGSRHSEAEEYVPFFYGYHNLMRNKIQNILMVSSFYDAFILEEDGGLSEQIYGEYRDLDLTSPPRIYRVSTGKQALKELRKRSYDLIISMTQIFDMDPVEFGKKAKGLQPGIPVVLLVTDTSALAQYHVPGEYSGFDKVFLWLGDSSLFLAIIKYFEDLMNIDDDTKNGMVRVILVIEDSARYYSTFLPLIYKEVMRQKRTLVAQGLNEHDKLLRRRARPKILLAESFEESREMYDRYRKNILGVITDVSFPLGGKRCDDSGFRFVETINSYIPVLIQSSNDDHKERADTLHIPFLNKNSETLLRDLSDFMKRELGFGDFIFRLPDGTEVGRASNLRELGELIGEMPAESLTFHGKAYKFSKWLFARGEFKLAMKIRYQKFSDFKTTEEIRDYLVNTIGKKRRKKQLGVITDFSQQSFEFEATYTRFGRGSLGGKGRGIAFLAALLRMNPIGKKFPDLHIGIPDTLVVGTEEFDLFIEENELHGIVSEDISDRDISSRFIASVLPSPIKEGLVKYLDHVKGPIAVRSSSLLEDSLHQPFAGIYSTYILPNNHKDPVKRQEQLYSAIKLVYASAFHSSARAYIRSTHSKVEEEKMAVVIQKLVGNDYDGKFYPILSGVAASRNYYPLPPMKRESGIASIAMGLGKIVMDGGKVLSFSPDSPRAIPGFSTPKEILANTQQHFFHLNMDTKDFDLAEGEDATLLRSAITNAGKNSPLHMMTSVYDPNDNIIRDSSLGDGYKVLTFANFLKYDSYPLAEILRELLLVGEKGMGGPVEIEFAVSRGNDDKLEFYILQIRPINPLREMGQVRIEEHVTRDAGLVFSSRALGNILLEDMKDILVVLPSRFDRGKTPDIASEIGAINSKMGGTHYILMGPGRWGSFDRWLGIPVEWSHISEARAIVEAPIEDISVDPSFGSHFFHNICALGIPYLTVLGGSKEDHIDWAWLEKETPRWEGKFVRHVRLKEPLTIKVDGRTGKGLILKGRDC